MKNVKKAFIIIFLIGLLFISACSSASSNNSEGKMMSTEQNSSMDMAVTDEAVSEIKGEESQSQSSKEGTTTNSETRMIAYEAQLSITVKGLDQKVSIFQKEIENLEGYLVESSLYEIGNGKKSARIVARVPQEKFEGFLTFVEAQSEKVNEQNVHGQDVTEEYVDLEARLKAKKIVEERLLTFMQNAERTEDLLKISNDLGRVQEEIEQVEGRMKFLRNRTAFSSVTINIQDSEIVVPSINKEDLNTWQQSKKTFIETINGLKGFISGLIIFIVGFSPVWFLFSIIGVLILVLLRRRKKNNES